ncbi:MAG: nicotinamide mononucleotide transporter [Clostridia bacterium]|nr:nicotinamide mononucleotide transporter [Clostridia bacterium]
MKLTKFELLLWAASSLAVTASFFLSPEKNYLTLITSLLGAAALIYLAKGYVLGQVLTLIFASLYGVISLSFRYYGEAISYLCMSAPMALLSLFSWLKNPYGKRSEVRIARLKRRHLIILLPLSASVTVAFYFILRALNTPNLVLSTVSILTSFVASYLTYARSKYYALAYALNDIVLITLWVLASLTDPSYVPMTACFLAFLFNDLYAFFNWGKMSEKQERGV